MNYIKHYNVLVERAKTKSSTSEYRERHHVVPRCLGGSDDADNIVSLTPEEHYVAHQLLVKMYPDHKGLVWAALQMTGQPNGKRSNNKLYGWLRRKYQKVAKQRVGKKNGSYGKSWYYDPVTLDNIKCLPEEVPDGYVKGRKLKPDNTCIKCNRTTGNKKAIYCTKHRKEHQMNIAKERGLSDRKYSEIDIIKAIKISKNLREACFNLGIKVIGGRDYTRIKAIMKKYDLTF